MLHIFIWRQFQFENVPYTLSVRLTSSLGRMYNIPLRSASSDQGPRFPQIDLLGASWLGSVIQGHLGCCIWGNYAGVVTFIHLVLQKDSEHPQWNKISHLFHFCFDHLAVKLLYPSQDWIPFSMIFLMTWALNFCSGGSLCNRIDQMCVKYIASMGV